jgi:putative (di)nucleoside polyphosphate hydrolase
MGKKRLTFDQQSNIRNTGKQHTALMVRIHALDKVLMIDPDGYRPNVGIVLLNHDRRVFWAQRVSNDGWQFPQGGMNTDETPVEAMYRELHEETGLLPRHVELLGNTPGWLRYRLPRRYQRQLSKPLCIGQKQVWFLLRFLADDSAFSLSRTEEPEFCDFRWVDFWYPAENVIIFKRRVYRKALSLLEPLLENPGNTISA